MSISLKTRKGHLAHFCSRIRSFLSEAIVKCRVDLGSEEQNRQFHDVLSELVTILFAVVFGVGLSEILSVSGSSDWLVLITTYLSITLSWAGYHHGRIKGPAETNWLCYMIDISIVIVYWLLINFRCPTVWPLLHTALFFLYTIWEGIRYVENPGRRVIARALTTNIVFLFFMSVSYVLDMSFTLIGAALYILVLVFTYRIAIFKVYNSVDQCLPNSGQYAKNDSELVASAISAMSMARATISGYSVGAAVRCDSGKIYTGANIEFANFSNTIHAEECAIASAVMAGEKNILTIAVVTTSNKLTWPCGMCLQSLHEIGGVNLRVIACGGGKEACMKVSELLPHGFDLVQQEK